MAELSSSMPTSGGLYYASAVLAGPKYGPFAAVSNTQVSQANSSQAGFVADCFWPS